MITLEQTLKLPDTDAAGIAFFGNYFRMAHEAYELFMDQIGFGLRIVLDKSEILILIAHADADYHAPLRLGDKYSIELEVEKIGRTSYVLGYTFKDATGGSTAEVRTVHVAIEKATNETIPLPEKLRAGLQKHLASGS
ncbi:MAG TPA: thioesterase family protein [candidate division Zixibacteria bacterium]|nr:thioesterase family protein [candidate division Zixibacteria bacterium]